MKVAVYYNNKDLRIEERPRPKISKKEVLLRIEACGICGSDVMEWYRIKKAPRILGHEATGEIVEAGELVRDWKVGERVFISHHVPCYKCNYCQAGQHTLCDTLRSTNIDPGGFAEYARVPAINVKYGLFRLPEGVSYDMGTFIEPIGCVIRGQKQVAMKKEDTVLILGSGISGLIHIRTAKMMGCKVVATDINDYRLEQAEKAGSDMVLNANQDIPTLVKEFNNGKPADLVIAATAAQPALKQAFDSVARGGRILFFAPTAPGELIAMPLYDLYFKGITIKFSYAAARDDLNQAISFLEKDKVNMEKLITHRLPLSEIQQGFNLVAKADRSIKVIIHP